MEADATLLKYFGPGTFINTVGKKSFLVRLTKSYVTTDDFIFPKYALPFLPDEPVPARVLSGSDVHDMRLVINKGKKRLAKGWLEFIKANNLTVGKALYFSFVEGLDDGRFVCRVHIMGQPGDLAADFDNELSSVSSSSDGSDFRVMLDYGGSGTSADPLQID